MNNHTKDKEVFEKGLEAYHAKDLKMADAIFKSLEDIGCTHSKNMRQQIIFQKWHAKKNLS
jgi:hypothetical protein